MEAIYRKGKAFHARWYDWISVGWDDILGGYPDPFGGEVPKLNPLLSLLPIIFLLGGRP